MIVIYRYFFWHMAQLDVRLVYSFHGNRDYVFFFGHLTSCKIFSSASTKIVRFMKPPSKCGTLLISVDVIYFVSLMLMLLLFPVPLPFAIAVVYQYIEHNDLE